MNLENKFAQTYGRLHKKHETKKTANSLTETAVHNSVIMFASTISICHKGTPSRNMASVKYKSRQEAKNLATLSLHINPVVVLSDKYGR